MQGVKRGLRRLIIGATLSFLASLQFSYCLLWLLKHYLMLKKPPDVVEDEELEARGQHERPCANVGYPGILIHTAPLFQIVEETTELRAAVLAPRRSPVEETTHERIPARLRLLAHCRHVGIAQGHGQGARSRAQGYPCRP